MNSPSLNGEEKKKRYVLWDNLKNIVIAEVGLNRVFKAKTFYVVGLG